MRMKWIGKLTGGLLGAVALGPIGAALGVLLGHQFDEHGEALQAGPFAGEDVAALAGNGLEGPVRPLVTRIAAALGISPLELAHVEAVLRIQRGGPRPGEARGAPARDRSLEEAYRVLETSAGASDETVVKAYRRQLHRHHPDKLKANGLPESMMA